MFPNNIKLSEALEIVHKDKNFRAKTEGDVVFVSYYHQRRDTFPDPEQQEKGTQEHRESLVRRECRGLAFSKNTERVVARRIHKFFNVNEKAETHQDKIELENKPYILVEKLDGSLIGPVFINNELRFATKLGISDICLKAEDFVQNMNCKSPYTEFSKHMLNEDNISPIFEFCSPESRIVVNYDKPSLTLIALRYNDIGEYISYDEMVTIAEKWNIPVVPKLKLERGFDSMSDLMNYVRQQKEMEGFVLRFDDGRMFKIKSSWYVLLHGNKPKSRSQKRILWRTILNNETDDFLATLSDPNERQKYSDFIQQAQDNIGQISLEVTKILNESIDQYPERKNFFIHVVQELKKEKKEYPFKLMGHLRSEQEINHHSKLDESYVQEQFIKSLNKEPPEKIEIVLNMETIDIASLHLKMVEDNIDSISKIE
eukprot:gb/GECH01002765.1/.p1 GENE.gb/GECH01002765.1/~~gb/GECH01002765.1/.p1  ORF type:complete len:428 (+),score=121.78 gb/GECH01002765.1/:1-1284(+)